MSLRRLLATTALSGLAAAGPAAAETVFNRIAAFAVATNMAAGEDTGRESSAEIIAATGDGLRLVYTDSPLGAVGLIDIADPAAPAPLGSIAVAGEPTSVAVSGTTAFVAVNTSEGYTSPSGHLVAIDLDRRAETARCALGGQPDAVAIAPDGSFLAVAIENERDEDLDDGAIPQLPAGFVAILPLAGGLPDCAGLRIADLTGLAAVAPEDPEPEFVDISTAGEIVVTLQENNHIAVLARDGTVVAHFPAGAVTLEGADLSRDGRLSFTETQRDRRREPDAVKWIDADHFATANEGDYEGGSRGWTVWRRDGTVVWESGASLEHAIAAIGHYPEGRSRSKGIEPEGLEVAVFDGTPMLFVLSERASVAAVYDVTDPAAPVLLQLLPSGISPEGAVAIPARGLLATANEVDLGADGGARAHVMLYARQPGPPAYPTITAAGAATPVGWGALSGAVADPEVPGRLWAVSDSVYAMAPAIYEIDATQVPARILRAIPVTRLGQPAQLLDLEGITTDGTGGFWLASEGRTDRLVPHALYRVDGNGRITAEVALPGDLAAHEIRFGFEGITRVGATLWIAVQREWRDDPAGLVKLLAYDTGAKSWGGVHYPLEAPAAGAWMGLSEITAHGEGVYIVERDNQIGAAARVKRVYRVPLADLAPAPLGGSLPVVRKDLVRDLLPDLARWGGYVQDKVESLAIDAAGTAYLVTDNDGVADASGETHFWAFGPVE